MGEPADDETPPFSTRNAPGFKSTTSRRGTLHTYATLEFGGSEFYFYQVPGIMHITGYCYMKGTLHEQMNSLVAWWRRADVLLTRRSVNVCHWQSACSHLSVLSCHDYWYRRHDMIRIRTLYISRADVLTYQVDMYTQYTLKSVSRIRLLIELRAVDMLTPCCTHARNPQEFVTFCCTNCCLFLSFPLPTLYKEST